MLVSGPEPKAEGGYQRGETLIGDGPIGLSGD